MPFSQHNNIEDEARSAMQLPKNSKKRARLSISIPSPPRSSPLSPPSSSPPPSSQVSPLSPPSSPPSSPLSSPPSSQSSATLSFTTAPESSPKLWDFCHDLPTRPASPLSWTWKCHSCRNIWRLGTTQRCLHCGHQMCIGPTELKQRAEANNRLKKRRKTCSSTLAGRTADGSRRPLGWWQQNRQKPSPLSRGLLMKNAKAKRIVRRCHSTFDFTGWESWNRWRKELRAIRDKGDDGHQNDSDDDNTDFLTDDYNFFDSDDDDDKKEEQTMIIRPTQGRLGVVDAKNESRSELLQYNCWNECNYPSQCNHDGLAAGKRLFSIAAE